MPEIETFATLTLLPYPARLQRNKAENMMIGAEKMDNTVIHTTASSITERTKEIESLLW